uniref:Synembryn-A n=1 Tax=Plectus sambesii TaxID=2011161 RepID=A0A914VC31_9BILA
MTTLSMDLLASLREITDNEVIAQLSPLNATLTQRFAFPDVDETAKSEISKVLFARLSTVTPACLGAFLELIRILSRDRHGIDALISEQTTDLLSVAAGCQSVQIADLTSKSINLQVVLEAQKCLSNALYHSRVVRDRFMTSGAFDDIANRIKQRASAPTIPGEQELMLFSLQPMDASIAVKDAAQLRQFDLRLCFIVSAHAVEAQERLRDILRVVESLVVLFDQHISHSTSLSPTNDDELSCEILKLLFNIFCHAKKDSLNNETIPKFECMVKLCERAIKEAQSTVGNVPDLAQNAVNLLATLPTAVLLLTPRPIGDSEGASSHPSYDGYDMSFVNALLQLFVRKLETVNKTETELLSTYLSVLIYISRSSKQARRYLRLKVVPPLHASDVEKRPEEGDSLRSRVVRLMMSTSQARDLAAEFLFVLCKRSGTSPFALRSSHAVALTSRYFF